MKLRNIAYHKNTTSNCLSVNIIALKLLLCPNQLGTVHKNVRIKLIKKLILSLVCKTLARFQPPPCGHFNFQKFLSFCKNLDVKKPLSEKNPPRAVDVFYGKPLTVDSQINFLIEYYWIYYTWSKIRLTENVFLLTSPTQP